MQITMKILINLHLLFLLLNIIIIYHTPLVKSFSHCPNCGQTQVPFPLSTNPHCGNPSYKVRCNNGTIWFDTLNGSSYIITTINPQTQRFIIQPPGLASPTTCVSSDYQTQGMSLDPNAPFNITSSNTLVFMNCSNEVLTLLWNCTSSSACHSYVRAHAMACGGGICCTVKTGGSVTEYRIRVRKERCAAYVSFAYLDDSAPVSAWPEPGVEIEWESPEEPACRASIDCGGLANSACSPLPAPVMGGGLSRKCLCNSGFQWDPITGTCQNIKCGQGGGCKHRNKKKSQLIGGLAFAMAAMIAGILITATVFRYQRQKAAQIKSRNRAQDILNADNNSGRSAKIFTIKEITKATNNFSKHNLIGSGGFGDVFKGTLSDGTLTAIKRAKLGNTRAADQILNEVRILCQLNHRNLVHLLGCCIELPHNEPLLIYEYVPNGTLFDHLHNAGKWAPLRWHQRLKIAHQTAEGLSYLHNSAIPRIFHRDVKSSNILLDDNLNAKVSDFGLSKLAKNEASHVTTCAQGTLGYLDPEYYMNFQVTDKSDVYSFGVVLLEMLTAKKALDFGREEEDVNLVVFVKRAMKRMRLTEVIDPTVRIGANKLELESMKELGCLAIACLYEQRQNRPSMKDVADEIQHILHSLSSHDDTIAFIKKYEGSAEFILQ